MFSQVYKNQIRKLIQTNLILHLKAGRSGMQNNMTSYKEPVDSRQNKSLFFSPSQKMHVNKCETIL